LFDHEHDVGALHHRAAVPFEVALGVDRSAYAAAPHCSAFLSW
jgi:hypothetical protein